MELENSKVIEKIIKEKNRPLQLTGYISAVESKSEVFRLYPKLDPTSYYELKKSNVIDVLDANNKSDDRKTVLIENDCEFGLVVRTTHNSKDYEPGSDDTVWVPLRYKLPPFLDRLNFYRQIGIDLSGYLGYESIPGPGQTGNPSDDL